MLLRSLISLLVCAGCSFCLFAQNKVANDSEVWPQYYVQAPLNKKWGLAADYSHRYSGLFGEKTQWIGRAGFSYMFNRQFSAAAGYAYSEYFPVTGVRVENRPWQQVQMDNSFQGLKLSHRLRLEERFQKDRFAQRFNYRWRYQLSALIPMVSKQRLFLNFSDEIMVNSGRQVNGNHFDQNRFQAGLQIKLAEHVFLTPAYLYTFQLQSNKRAFRNIDIIRTGIIYKREN